MVSDRVFTSFCVEKGAMTINQYYFHAVSRKRQGWFYFRKFALYLCHATVNKQKTEKNQFHKKITIISSHAADMDSMEVLQYTTMSDNYQAVIPSVMKGNACFVGPSCHNSS